MNSRHAIRILQVSLAVLGLLVFTVVVSSGLHHHDSVDDSHCPYCHLGHQTPNQPEAPLCVAVLKPLASVQLPDDAVAPTGLAFSRTSPRAPPSA